jgi:TRAP-type C4-dicarboxylate transport system permease small subunit
MTPRSLWAAGWLQRRAEDVAGALLATMFLAFLIQILFRYLLNWPTGWTHELSILAWLWGVLWGAAFVVREREEIRFDILYGSVGARTRRLFTLITAAVFLAIFVVSLPAVVDYVGFMRVERSAYLKLRFDWLFAIYVVFVLAMIARYGWLLWRAVRGEAPRIDPLAGGSAL